MGKRDNTPVIIFPKCDVYAACFFLWWRFKHCAPICLAAIKERFGYLAPDLGRK
jgi:hypothetical protein